MTLTQKQRAKVWRLGLASSIVILFGLSVWIAWALRTDALDLTAAIWTLWAGAGVLAMSVLVYHSIRDLKRYEKLPHPDNAIVNIGRGNVRRDCIRLVKVIALFAIGLMVLTDTANTYISRLLLILVAGGIVANAFLDLLEREHTDTLIDGKRSKL
jgi:hypothetical protein